MKKNILVGQSGGPTAVINSSLYGVITEGFKQKDSIEHVYGAVNGIEGFLKGHVINLRTELNPEELDALKTTPGAYLGSCRYKLPEDLTDPVYPALFDKFEQLNIGYFFYIGGNDSMDTVSKLSRYAQSNKKNIRIIGIPKTIDNDLVLTDHTPGFGSAARFVASTVREIGMDAAIYDTKSVTIVEIMGRHAGWLTGASVLARQTPLDNPVLIYLPEVDFDEEKFLTDLTRAFEHKQNLIVCVSEGIHDKDGAFVCEHANDIATDTFGHKILTGCGKYLENLVKNRLHVKVRSVELNVTQRCASAHLSCTDLTEAAEAGSMGVRLALAGETGKMIAFLRSDTEGYSIDYVPVDVNEVCNLEKCVPLSWITKDGTDLSSEFINYVLPLIQGSCDVPLKNGLPVFAVRKR